MSEPLQFDELLFEDAEPSYDELPASYSRISERYSQLVAALQASAPTAVSRCISTSTEILRLRANGLQDPKLHSMEATELARVAVISAVKTGVVRLFTGDDEDFHPISPGDLEDPIWNRILLTGQHLRRTGKSLKKSVALYVLNSEFSKFVERLHFHLFIGQNTNAIAVSALGRPIPWGDIPQVHRVSLKDVVEYTVIATERDAPISANLAGGTVLSLAAAGLVRVGADRAEAETRSPAGVLLTTKFGSREAQVFLSELAAHFMHAHDEELPAPATAIERDAATGTFSLAMVGAATDVALKLGVWGLHFDDREIRAEFTNNPHTIIPKTPGPVKPQAKRGHPGKAYGALAVQHAVDVIRCLDKVPKPPEIDRILEDWILSDQNPYPPPPGEPHPGTIKGYQRKVRQIVGK